MLNFVFLKIKISLTKHRRFPGFSQLLFGKISSVLYPAQNSLELLRRKVLLYFYYYICLIQRSKSCVCSNWFLCFVSVIYSDKRKIWITRDSQVSWKVQFIFVILRCNYWNCFRNQRAQKFENLIYNFLKKLLLSKSTS